MKTLNGKKVLVTGSTGFIGANLVKKSLGEGAELHILIRDTSYKWRINDVLEGVNIYHVDLSDYGHLKDIVLNIRPDIIYHTAAYGGSPFQRDFWNIIKSNFIGTANLVNACKNMDFELFVNTGSSSEYGIKAFPMRESDLLEPVNDYGVSKSAATLYCQSVAKNENLPIVTLRLFSPYGRHEGPTRLIPSVIMACIKNEKIKISSTKLVRDFIYIDDVLGAYAKLTGAYKISGQIFNIGGGEQHSIGEVVNKIIELTGSEMVPETEGAPRWPNEPDRWQADISKAKHLLNWHPKYNLEKGLNATIKWFEENMPLYEECRRI